MNRSYLIGFLATLFIVAPAFEQTRSRRPPQTARQGKRSMWRNKIGMSFSFVPAGSFLMGSEAGQPDERPAHQVTISKGFYMGRFEVTQEQWRTVMGTTLRQQVPSHKGSFKGEGDSYPMYDVSWDNAQEFIRRLNQWKDGYTYRLPTEAEWEYACRVGNTRNSSESLDDIAWYSGNETHPVGMKRPNALGLYDMLGNVWEWCQDFYDANYYRSNPNKDPPGPPAAKSRVYRGGQYSIPAELLRCETRDWGTPSIPGGNAGLNGFRVVAVR